MHKGQAPIKCLNVLLCTLSMSHCIPSWMTTARMRSCTLATASVFYVRSGTLACSPWLTRPVGILRSASVSWNRFSPLWQGVQESKSPRIPRSSSSVACPQGQGVQGPSGRTPIIDDPVWRPGDWRCDACGNWNYASRTQCHSKHRQRSYLKTGDRACPDCNNHTCASRECCDAHRCKAPRRYVLEGQGFPGPERKRVMGLGPH